MTSIDPLTIRKALVSDAKAIADILNYYIAHSSAIFVTVPVTAEHMCEIIQNVDFPFYVCTEGSEVLGYCYAHRWKERECYAPTWENSVYVHHQHLHRGIGKALMERLVPECFKMGCHSLIACITAENSSSIAFHESLGFKKVSHFEQVGLKDGRYLDVVDLQLMNPNVRLR